MSLQHRPAAQARSTYRAFYPVGTRWMDNDLYGHVNNVVYYSFFDTAVNGYLIAAGALDIHAGAVIGLVIETHCNYFPRWRFLKRWRRACAWPTWAAPACATRWDCLRRVSR